MGRILHTSHVKGFQLPVAGILKVLPTSNTLNNIAVKLIGDYVKELFMECRSVSYRMFLLRKKASMLWF